MLNIMKALILCGGRRGGLTSTMCEMFAEGARSKGIESMVLYPIEMDIRHCDGGNECSEEKRCIIDDEMSTIYRSFKGSDILVLSSPVRFSGPSSIIKTVIDRFQVYWYDKGDRPSYVVALLNGGMENPRFDNILSSFKAFSITTDMDWMGELMIPGTDSLSRDDVRVPSFNFGVETASKIKDR